MKKFLVILAAVAALGMVSCQKEDKPQGEEPKPEVKAPVADFDYTIDGLVVTFTNKSENAVSYKWAFGDEETSKEQNPKHEYAAAGEYTVVLTAANSEGATSKKEAKFTLAGKVQAYFSAVTPEGRAAEWGKAVQFDATSSANAASIAWEFGDGETSTEFAPLHVFPGFGKYTVKATVTGIGGDVDTYTQEVTTVKNVVVIKGGSMNADDAAYWQLGQHWGYDAGQYVDVEGVYAYGHEFGNTDRQIKGNGPVHKFISNPLGWDYNNKGSIYQGFEVKAGDVFEVDCLVAWGEETQDNGNFSIKVSYGEYDPGASATLFWFNNFWGVHDPDEEDDTRWTRWVPAFEGNIAECAEALADYGAGAAEGVLTENGKIQFTATQDGMCYLMFYCNQVWGFAFGPGRDLYLDEVSCVAVVD